MVFFDAFSKDTARLLMVSSQVAGSSLYDIDSMSSLLRQLAMMDSESDTTTRHKRAAEDLNTSSEAKKARSTPAAGSQPAEEKRTFGKTFAEHLKANTCSKCNGARLRGAQHTCNTAIKSAKQPVIRMMTRTRGVKRAAKEDALHVAKLSARVDKALAAARASTTSPVMPTVPVVSAASVPIQSAVEEDTEMVDAPASGHDDSQEDL
ncbi:hypothetical protein MBANPS3_012672, partial [Mucor bainieri]